MPVKELRCGASVGFGHDPTGEYAQDCGANALVCADFGGPAGCTERAEFCPTCSEPVCVDDGALGFINRKLLLQKYGHQLLTASNVRCAIELIVNHTGLMMVAMKMQPTQG